MNHWDKIIGGGLYSFFVACTAGNYLKDKVSPMIPNKPNNTSAMDRSLYEHYTRHTDADVGKVSRGVASRSTREILCQIMPADEWTAIEIAAKADIGSDIAEAWRLRAGYFWDAPDVLDMGEQNL